MNNLIQFLLKQIPFFVYLIYAAISLFMLFKSNSYHNSVFISSANNFTGAVYSVSGNITSYFGLKDINQDLLERNGHLEKEIQILKEMLKDQRYDELMVDKNSKYDFIMAQVINNSVSMYENYITIDKGSRDGIKSQMGVVDQNGIIGIVSTVGEKYSVVISLLNTKLRLSAKLKNSDFFGSLVWDGVNADYAVLEELPLHVSFAPGDTVVTSGYSAAFPEGLPVGYVVGSETDKGTNFYSLKIKLATEFQRLNDVRVIINSEQEEQKQIEAQSKK